MTNKQIKDESIKRLRDTWGDCISLTVIMLAVLFFFVMCEVLVFLVLKYNGYVESYSFFNGSGGYYSAAMKIILVWLCLCPELYVFRRYFIDIGKNRSIVTVRQYFTANIVALTKRSLLGSLILLGLKVFTAMPLVVGIYGVYYWSWVAKLDNIASMELFLFMLCLGLTLVWFGLWIKYCVSLCLVPYILTLNPKTNIFDACDLSCKLMDGRHLRFFSFWGYNLRYILLCVLFFPSFAVIPMVQMSYTLFIEDIMGDYWQDKYPLMIERWKKRAL